MGDNIYLGDRNGVRTPMQWTGDRNGGFSRADPARLFAPPIMDPVYGFQAINVEAQERAPFSLLNWMKRMIGLRKQYKVFGRGAIEFLPAQNRKVLAYVRRYEDDTILCVANLARSVQPVELDLSRFRGLIPVEMLGLTEFPRIGERPYFLTLGTYGFYWFRLQQAAPAVAARIAPELATDVPAAPALLVGAAWDTLLEGNVRTLIERDMLVPFLQRQRWFGGKARRVRGARFVDWGLLRKGPQPLFLTLLEVEYEDGGRETYFLPLAVCAPAEARGLEERAPHAILANITGARKGTLFDAWLDDHFALTVLEAIGADEQLRTKRATIRTLRTGLFDRLRGLGDGPHVRRMSAEQSNTSIVYGDRLILKLFRRIQPGINPDFEIGRQLTEKAGFTRVPAVAAAIEYAGVAESPSTLGMVQQFVESQADGWRHATDEVARFYEAVEGRTAPSDPLPRSYSELVSARPPAEIIDVMRGYPGTAETLGRRTAEMHLALAADSADPAFAPEPFSKADLADVVADAVAQAQKAFDALQTAAPGQLTLEVETRARTLLESRETLLDRIRSGPALEFAVSKIRVHGDYHLGQVLWVEGDFYIFDFEGEPARPVGERRRKQSPLRDVAGMVRSFGYAAFAALFAYTASRPTEFHRVEAWARIWQTWATASFLRGYFGATAGSLFVPPEPSQRDALLQLFVLDKALYELNYELNNRPQWIRIPLWSVIEALGGRE
jgi:maltose alpha-D-glucosyltransferase/alpha-amylase